MKDLTLDLEELSLADYVCINLDLILYQNEDLLNKAFELLIGFHQQRDSLFNLLSQVQLLETEEEINIFRETEEKLSLLNRHSEKSEFWLGSEETQNLSISLEVIKILDFIGEKCIRPTIGSQQLKSEALGILEPETEDQDLLSIRGKKSNLDVDRVTSLYISSQKPFSSSSEQSDKKY